MRTSRIDSFGGMRPPVKPSIKICPPFGPADGPAIACTAAESASGSSGSTSRSWPLKRPHRRCFRIGIQTLFFGNGDDLFSSVTTRRTS